MAKYKIQFIGEEEFGEEVEGYIGSLFLIYNNKDGKKVFVPISSIKKVIEIEPDKSPETL